MKIITRSEMTWDPVLQQYVVTEEVSEDYHGPVADCKGGGSKGIIGLVGSLAIPFAAPALATTLGVSTTVAGAGMGAALGLATGGTKGMMLGALGGGLSGYAAGGGKFFGESGLFGGGDAVTGVSGIEGAGSGVSSMGSPTGVEAFTGGSGSGAFSGAIAGGDFAAGYGAGLGGGGMFSTINPGVSAFTGMPAAALGPNPAMSSIAPGSVFDPLDANTGGFFTEGAAAGDLGTGASGAGAADPNKPGILDKLKEGAVNAGIRLGSQYIADQLVPTPEGLDPDSMNSYLQAQSALDKQVFDLNKQQWMEKNQDADAVENIAANYDPQYLGRNAMAQTMNRDNASWQEMERRLRAQGYDDSYINSERNRFNLGKSQNAGTAYTQGVDAGYKSQTGMYATGAGIRDYLPGANNSSSYQQMMQLYDQYNRDKQSAGGAIEQIFEPLGPTTTTGADDTRDKREQPQQ